MDAVPDRDLVVPRGLERTIAFASDAQGRRPAQEFLRSVEVEADRKALFHLFRQLADTGRLASTSRFRKEAGEIWSFKTRSGIRIAAFPFGRVWFLTHGFIKKKDRWPRMELERAERIRAEHLCQWLRNRTRT